jgi:hypothetical protein
VSRIAVVVDDETVSANVIQRISLIAGVALLEVKKRVAGRQPVMEFVLFQNDYLETFKVLRELVSYLAESRHNFQIFELNEQQTFESTSVHEKDAISVATLEEILRGFESERKRFGS